MVADVEEVFAVFVLPRTAIREVDESCQLCSEEVDEMFLEEVNNNGVMNIAVRYITSYLMWANQRCHEYCSQIYHNVADVGQPTVS